MLPLSIVRNTLLHPFYSKSSLNLWRWLLLLSSLASMTSCIARSTKLPCDHPLHQLFPIFLSAAMNLNFFRPLPSQRSITGIWITTFVVFSNEYECDLFLDSLNSLHPLLRFAFEKESNLTLPFLDVSVEKSPSKFITSIYRKPKFTGQYLR